MVAGALLTSDSVAAGKPGDLRLATFRFEHRRKPFALRGWIGRLLVTILEAMGYVLLGVGKPIVVCAVDWTGLANSRIGERLWLMARTASIELLLNVCISTTLPCLYGCAGDCSGTGRLAHIVNFFRSLPKTPGTQQSQRSPVTLRVEARAER